MSKGTDHIHGGKRYTKRYSNKRRSYGKRNFDTRHTRKYARQTAKKSRKPLTLFEKIFGL